VCLILLTIIEFKDVLFNNESNKWVNISAPKVHLKVFMIQKNLEISKKEFGAS
jgi:hypothetical protein